MRNPLPVRSDPEEMDLDALINEVIELRSRCDAYEGRDDDRWVKMFGLTPTQNRLFSLLAAHLGTVVFHQRIRNWMWDDRPGETPLSETNVVAVHACHINRKLPPTLRIEGEFGFGYRLVGELPAPAANEVSA